MTDVAIAPGIYRRRRHCQRCGDVGDTQVVEAFVIVGDTITNAVICGACLPGPLRQALHRARREYANEWRLDDGEAP